MTRKKYRLESHHFMAFRGLAQDFPAGEVWHDDSPDFVIHSEKGIIGVEHCLVQIPTRQRMPLQAIESQTDEIVSIAQEHAELRGVPPIHATFLFGHFTHMEKKERINLARDIARLVHDKIAEVGIIEPLTRFILRYPDLPLQISSIHILTLKEDSRHFWTCARAGWAMKNCVDIFQKTISRKEELLRTYREKCDKCWLLMAAEPKPSGFIHPDQDSTSHVFRSSFDKVNFLDMSERKLYVLKNVAI